MPVSFASLQPKPLVRLLNKPVVGRLTHRLLAHLSNKTALIRVHKRGSAFFAFDRDAVAGTKGMNAYIRPSQRRRSAYAPTCDDDDAGDDEPRQRRPASSSATAAAGGTVSAAPAGLSAEKLDRLARCTTYEAAFGYADGWEGAARGLLSVRLSPIHGRGLFAAADLPRGSLVIMHRQQAFIDAAALVLLTADVPTRIAAMSHYAQHIGGAFPLPVSPSPLHMVNHSCAPTLRCGFRFQRGTTAADHTAGFEPFGQADQAPPRFLSVAPEAPDVAEAAVDYNGYITARDVRAGEELTLDYGRYVTPSFPGQFVDMDPTPCHCGAPHCRGEVLPKSGRQWSFYRSRAAAEAKARAIVLPPGAPAPGPAEPVLEEELVALSLLRSRVPLLKAMHRTMPSAMDQKRDVVYSVDATLAHLAAVRAEADARPAATQR